MQNICVLSRGFPPFHGDDLRAVLAYASERVREDTVHALATLTTSPVRPLWFDVRDKP